jgi:hypothetical protein
MSPMLGTVLAVIAALAVSHPSPSLRFERLRPLAVSGHGFAAHERVRVRVHAGGASTTVRVRASAAGGVRATFERVAVGRCDPVVIDATGSTGDHAALQRRTPACAPG